MHFPAWQASAVSSAHLPCKFLCFQARYRGRPYPEAELLFLTCCLLLSPAALASVCSFLCSFMMSSRTKWEEEKRIAPALSTHSDSLFGCLQLSAVNTELAVLWATLDRQWKIKLSLESIGSIYWAPASWRLECSKWFKNVLPSSTSPPWAGQRFQTHVHWGIWSCRLPTSLREDVFAGAPGAQCGAENVFEKVWLEWP